METQPSIPEKVDKPQRTLRIEAHWITRTIFVILFIASAVLNIWQFYESAAWRVKVENCDLRVKNEADKVNTFMVTKDIIINDYWMAKENEFAIETGPALLSATRITLGVVDELTKKE